MESIEKNYVKKIIIYSLLLIFMMIFILPILLMFVTAFKVDESQLLEDLNSFRAFLPVGKVGIQNFIDVFNRLDVKHFFLNSLIITCTSVSLGLIVNSMLGYVLARLNFTGKKFLVAAVISLMIIPMEAITIPLLLIVNEMKIIDTYTVQIIPFIADAFSIFLFYQAFLMIPKDIEEAAIIDGMNYFKIYSKIVMPLSKATIITTCILNSLGRWGDVLWATMVTRGKSVRPLPIAMQQLFTTQPQVWGDIFAFSCFMTVPILVIFLIFQKQFISSMASSGVKG
jgi:multiple sugar transport system permease protein